MSTYRVLFECGCYSRRAPALNTVVIVACIFCKLNLILYSYLLLFGIVILSQACPMRNFFKTRIHINICQQKRVKLQYNLTIFLTFWFLLFCIQKNQINPNVQFGQAELMIPNTIYFFNDLELSNKPYMIRFLIF